MLDLADSWQGHLGELRIRALPLNGPFPGLAYRFELGGRSIVVSGDPAYEPEMVALARGADLLVQAATVTPTPLAARRLAERLYAQLGGGPLSPERAGKLAHDAEVRHLVLTHLLPEVRPADLTARAASHFGGKITVGEDLQEILIQP